MKTRFGLLIPALASLAFPMHFAQGQSTQWKDPIEGLWKDSENWSAGVPASASPVSIFRGTATIIADEEAASYSTLLVEAQEGVAHLAVEGNSVSGGSTTLGFLANYTGSAAIANGTWSAGSFFYVGRNGNGFLQVNGGAVSANEFSLGANEGAFGSVVLTGGNLVTSGALRVGNEGTGKLETSNGSVSANTMNFGNNAKGFGQGAITSGAWSAASLSVGWSGGGELTVGGGAINTTTSTVGVARDSEGVVNMSGGTWTNTGDFTVGRAGNATFDFSGGSIVMRTQDSTFLIGQTATSEATMTVSGGSLVADYVDAGQQGKGTLNISEGFVQSRGSFFGEQAGHGILNVSGGVLNVSQQLVLGFYGTGEAHISGGRVEAAQTVLGYLNASATRRSAGTLTISGGEYLSDAEMIVGVQGDGELMITGGRLWVDGGVYGAYTSAGKSLISVLGNEQGSGVLETTAIEALNANADLVLDGGTLRALESTEALITGDESGRVVVGSGGVKIDSQQFEIAIDSGLSGEGGITKLGAGSLTLLMAGTMSGTHRIVEGTLIIGHNQALGSGEVRLEGGTLALSAGISPEGTRILMGEGTFQQQASAGDSLVTALELARETADGMISVGLLQGTASSESTVSYAFSASSSASNDFVRFGDVVHLDGFSEIDDLTGETDRFTLFFSTEEFSGQLYIGWFDERANRWVNAAMGNFGGEMNFLGDKAYNPLTDFELGNYGYDQSQNSYWAVLNHNSDFALIPEPGSFALLGLGGTLLLFRQRRRA